QSRTQILVILHQSASQAVANCTGLTEATAAAHSDVYVELINQINVFQWLTNHHARNRTTEVLVEGAIIYSDNTSASGNKYARGRGLATTSTIVLSCRHDQTP